jgi:hypothetical protein
MPLAYPMRMSAKDLHEPIDDRARIDVSQNRDIAFWAARLGVRRSQLITAVAATGPRACDVARYLRNRRERAAAATSDAGR